MVMQSGDGGSDDDDNNNNNNNRHKFLRINQNTDACGFTRRPHVII